MSLPRLPIRRRQFRAHGAAGLRLHAEDDEARRKVAADRNRPQFHVVPPAHLLNDPNEPLYWKGRYHLFCPYAPGDDLLRPAIDSDSCRVMITPKKRFRRVS